MTFSHVCFVHAVSPIPSFSLVSHPKYSPFPFHTKTVFVENEYLAWKDISKSAVCMSPELPDYSLALVVDPSIKNAWKSQCQTRWSGYCRTG